jgi:ABC-2 type transport system permease protein
MCAASLLLGLIVVNMTAEGGLALYRGRALAAMAVLGLLGAVFIAAIGSIISLRTPTVRQAQQTLGGVILVLFVLPVAAVRMLPDAWKQDAAAQAALGAQLATAGIGALIVIDAALVWFALSRFTRARLIAIQ